MFTLRLFWSCLCYATYVLTYVSYVMRLSEPYMPPDFYLTFVVWYKCGWVNAQTVERMTMECYFPPDFLFTSTVG